jgi:hypothetical protein
MNNPTRPGEPQTAEEIVKLLMSGQVKESDGEPWVYMQNEAEAVAHALSPMIETLKAELARVQEILNREFTLHQKTYEGAFDLRSKLRAEVRKRLEAAIERVGLSLDRERLIRSSLPVLISEVLKIIAEELAKQSNPRTRP